MRPAYKSQALSNLVNGLEAVCKAYLAFKQGVATTLPPTYWQTGDTNQIVTRLRAELLLLVLPRILGVEQTDPPKTGETVEDYLMRMRAAAVARHDFELLSRTISAAREISSSIAGPGQSLIGQDYTSFLYWREGQNAERAKRFFEATLAYRRALSSATPPFQLSSLENDWTRSRKNIRWSLDRRLTSFEDTMAVTLRRAHTERRAD